MQTMMRNKSIGLDIGQTSGKILCLSRNGKRATVTRAAIFRLSDEGILGDNENEQFQAIGSWLKELKLLDRRLVLGLPQYMATTKVSDFAKGAGGRQLAQMVGYETTQLSGISDDVFIHDYTVLPPGNGRQNPVLIGLCREANVDDLADRATGVDIQLEDIAMSGLAVANAFTYLRPREWKQQTLQLLLDVGTESTTVLLMHSGQVLYIGGMMFGGENVTQELARQLEITPAEAEQRKLRGQVDWASLNLQALAEDAEGDDAAAEQHRTAEDRTPRLGLKLPGIDRLRETGAKAERRNIQGLACFKTMVRELENCLEHWRSTEQEELGKLKPAKIWLCGGGAYLDQIATYLEVSQNCPVELFGPQVEKQAPESPEYVVAYGLALQGLGLARYAISLTPTALAWTRRKEARAKFLLASFLLVLATVVGWFSYRYLNLRNNLQNMEQEAVELEANVKKLGQLDGMKRDYLETLLQAMPVVENNIQTGRFLRVLTLLQDAVKNPGVADCRNWCVYVADEASFKEHNVVKESRTAKEPELQLGRRANRRRILETTDQPQEAEGIWETTLKEEKITHDVVEMTASRTFYVVGVIMSKFDNHNKIEEQIMARLKQSRADDRKEAPLMFSDVQLMSESERTRCKARAVYDWENCLVNMRTSEAFKSYDHRSFFLRLTLRDPGVEVPSRNPLLPARSATRRRRR